MPGDQGFSRQTQRAVFYPSPFFDIAGTYYPDTPKALFRFCRYYYYTVGIIGAAVDIHAGYPITDLAIDCDDEKLEKRWKEIFDNFRIKSFLIEAGKDYVTFGNSFISMYLPFTRMLACPKCPFTGRIDTVPYEFKRFKFQGPCPKCDNTIEYKVRDERIKDLKRVNLVRWSPENIEIEYNPITGEHRYLYHMPNDVRRLIVMGRRHIIEKVPMEFINSVASNRPIAFNTKNIFHLKRPSLAEKSMGWGEPAITRVLKDLYYLQVLKKAREQIAHQHIVPLWVLFPQPHGELNPYEHLNLAEWRGRVEEEIKKWRQDPNYIPIMPMPLGFQFIGGTFKSMDTTPEMQNLMLNILAGMNMPQEFIYGGLTYSGTSFSIRMLSNLFSSYRSQLLDFINGFFIPTLSEFFSIKKVPAHFTDLKLADDVQKKQLLVNLNTLNKVSTGTLLTELGLDAKVELEKVRAELKESGDVLAQQMINQEKAKSGAMLENIRGQIKAQLMQQTMAQEVQEELMEKKVEFESEMDFKLNPNLFKTIFESKGDEDPHQDEAGKPFFVLNPVSVPDTVKALAKSIQGNNKKKRQEIMSELQVNMPHLHDLVAGEISMQPNGSAGTTEVLPRPRPPGAGAPARGKVDTRPAPKQKPPRRKGSGGQV